MDQQKSSKIVLSRADHSLWQLTLKPVRDMNDVRIMIKDELNHDDDRLKVAPDDGVISQDEEWMSGFREPERSPDFFVRKISFHTLRKVEVVKIAIRRARQAETQKVLRGVASLENVHRPASRPSPDLSADR